MVKANENVNGILAGIDLVIDEYGNYYNVVGDKAEGDKLTEVRVSHSFYEFGFSKLLSDEIKEKYHYKYLSVPIQDLLKGKVEHLESIGRRIFTIRELADQGVVVKFTDILSDHPRANPQ